MKHSEITHPAYRPDIDGLRAIAVLSVVFFHAFPSVLQGGFIGVDIFFVISGYLITTIILGSLKKNVFSFSTFYQRRIKRIFPALLLVLSSTLLFGWFGLLPEEYKDMNLQVISGIGFVANILFWWQSGYFDASAETKPLLHLWSLGIEEQFYIFWPFVLWYLTKKKFNVLYVTIALALVSLIICIITTSTHPTAAFYSPASRIWEILIGSILATIKLKNRPSSDPVGKNPIASSSARNPLNDLLSSLGCILLIIGMILITKERQFPGWWSVLPSLGTAFIIAAGANSWINRVLLSNKTLVWFGLISFPLYLWHWPLLSLARISEGDEISLALRTGIVLASIVLATLTYHFLETPLKKLSTSRKIVPVLSSAAVLLSVFVVVMLVNENFLRLQNHSPLVEKFGPYPHLPSHNDSCDERYPQFSKFSVCLLSKDRAPEVIIVGDSHSSQYYKSLAAQLPDKSVMNIAQFSCLPAAAENLRRQHECTLKTKAVLDFLNAEKSIEVVYLAGYWNYLAAGGFKSNTAGWRMAADLTQQKAKDFAKRMNYFVSEIRNRNKNIVLMKDIPDLEFNIKNCFQLRTVRIGFMRRDCSSPQEDFEKRTLLTNEVLSSLAKQYPGVAIFDPTPVFCTDRNARPQGTGNLFIIMSTTLISMAPTLW